MNELESSRTVKIELTGVEMTISYDYHCDDNGCEVDEITSIKIHGDVLGILSDSAFDIIRDGVANNLIGYIEQCDERNRLVKQGAS